MKTLCHVMLCLALCLVGSQAQTANNGNSQTGTAPPPTEYHVVDRGPSHRLWQREEYDLGPNGQVFTHIHQYKELASGMCYQQNGQWIDSQDLIEAYSAGAIARQGQYQVIFANDINSAGAIDQQTPDNKRIRSNILGLAYYDSTSGSSVLIAQIQDSQGELIGANQVLYPNAFAGIAGDVRYTYKKGRFEQDVILREQPPTPESLGLNSDTTEIEVLTEFIDPPDAVVLEHPRSDGNLPDQDISWGAMSLGRGKAFDLGEPSNVIPRVTVRRQYINLEGRQILIEGVPLPKIKASLSNLPLQSSTAVKSPIYASKTRALPKPRIAQAALNPRPMKFASDLPSRAGYVLDYVQLNSDQTNFIFRGDTTYYVSAVFDSKGVTTIEGGTVIKLDGNGEVDIDVAGSVNCETAAYRPGIFTSINDNSVGEGISGSTGTPAFGNVFYFLYLNATNVVLHDLRFSYAWVAMFQGEEPAALDAWNCQVQSGDVAVYGFNVGLHNVLIGRSTNGDAALLVEGPSLIAENVTANGGNSFVEPDYLHGVVALTNCLITAQPLMYPGYTITLYSNATVCLPSPTSPVYQIVGAGSYYLTNNSPYRNVGTTNINSLLLAEIASKTTYPPIVYSSTTISIPTSLSPQAGCDYIGNPDIGYHYDPLDYVFGNSVASSNLTFTAGTAVGYYYASSGGTYGLAMGDSATASFNGTATSPCYFVKYSTVQEGNGNWTSSSYVGGLTGQSYTHTVPGVTAQFTTFSTPTGETGFIRDNAANSLLHFAANNCEMYTGGGGYRTSINATNCLWVNAGVGLWQNYGAANITFENCTFFRGFILSHSGANNPWPVNVLNCAFDSTTFDMSPDGGPTNGYYTDYNSFIALTNINITPHFGGHELTNVINYHWQTSWFGNYYLPTNSPLTNAGSITANLVGLYHFTTQTNQVPETNSVVDIGYHYVATDGSGNPLDTNGDGIPDYIEDANGNGLVDSGEIGWNIVGDLGLQVIITQPENGSTLP